MIFSTKWTPRVGWYSRFSNRNRMGLWSDTNWIQFKRLKIHNDTIASTVVRRRLVNTYTWDENSLHVSPFLCFPSKWAYFATLHYSLAEVISSGTTELQYVAWRYRVYSTRHGMCCWCPRKVQQQPAVEYTPVLLTSKAYTWCVTDDQKYLFVKRKQ